MPQRTDPVKEGGGSRATPAAAGTAWPSSRDFRLWPDRRATLRKAC